MTASPDSEIRLGADRRTPDELLALDAPPATFFDDVFGWAYARRDLPLADTTPLLVRMRVLVDMAADVEVHDVGRFLEMSKEESRYAEQAIAWCEEMGATRAAELLRRAIALLPGGVFPVDEVTRIRAMNATRTAARAAGTRPFAALGEEFAGAMDELSERLHGMIAARWREVLGEVREMSARVARRGSGAGLLAIDDDMKFLEALDSAAERAYPVTGRARDGWSVLPPAVRVMRWLTGAYLYGSNDGAWKVLDTGDFHELWDDAQRWSRAIGADRFADWLAAVAGAFPGGRLPAGKDELMDAVAAFEETMPRDPADPWAGVDALARIDMEHAGAIDDMVAALRDFVDANATDPVAALDRVGRDEAGTPPTRTRQPRGATRGEPPAPLGHPALDALFAAAYRFTPADWARAVREHLATAVEYQAAYQRVGQTARAAAKAGTGAGGEEGRAARKQLDDRTWPMMHQIRVAIPAIYTDAEGPLPLQRRANQLLFAAKTVILVRDAIRDEVAADVATLLRPFGETVVRA